jgi:hypothetical protein
LRTNDSEDPDPPGTTTVSPHRHIHLALPLTILHIPYTSYLDTTQHHGAVGHPHIARDVRLYLIRTWCSVSKIRKKNKMLTFVVYKNKKYLIKEFNLLFSPIATKK